MQKRGFTLIELLVVIAIIGLLATITLVSIQDSRFKARDASIQQLMHQVRNAAEMNYIDNNETYAGVCDESDDTLTDTGEFGRLERAIKEDNGDEDVVCFESADKRDFAVSSPLVAKEGKYWCIESAGISIEISGPITSSSCE
ncbi:MAG: type II secretion system protein [Candidatus Nealsonbacteria bacterium]